MITCAFEDGGKGNLRHAVVDVILVKEQKILLVKRSEKISEGGKWAIIGGFMDRDETIVEAAERELREESGWTTKKLTLFRIIGKPDRLGEDRQNISFVFFGEGQEQIGDSDWEVTDKKWFDFDSLPDQLAFDHGESISKYLQYLKEPFQLPIIG